MSGWWDILHLRSFNIKLWTNSMNRTELRTKKRMNIRTDERKDENYIPLGINAGGIIRQSFLWRGSNVTTILLGWCKACISVFETCQEIDCVQLASECMMTIDKTHHKNSDSAVLSSKYIWAVTWQNQQTEHLPSLIRVFTVRMKKPWVLSYPMSTQQRLWSDWADAQADLSFRWVHSRFVGFVMSRLIYVCL